MGIDIYMKWKDGEPKRGYSFIDGGYIQDPSISFKDAYCGKNGYLRESYHGGPYATTVLVPEAFGDPGMWINIESTDLSDEVKEVISEDEEESGYYLYPAKLLRERLRKTLLTVTNRYRQVYHEELDEGAHALREYVDFVELAEQKEAETGHPVRIRASY